jgi:excisionase family DNA binding protein
MPNDYRSGEKLLTKGELAQLCRVEVRTIDRWLIAGKIKGYRTPSGRVLFRRNDVLIAIERKPAPGPTGEGRAYDANTERP